jgi:hypothetical protein
MHLAKSYSYSPGMAISSQVGSVGGTIEMETERR